MAEEAAARPAEPLALPAPAPSGAAGPTALEACAPPTDPRARFAARLDDAGFRKGAEELAKELVVHAGFAALRRFLPYPRVEATVRAEVTREAVEHRVRPAVDRLADRLIAAARKEERTVREVIGEPLARRLVEMAERADPPDSWVRSAFEQGPVERVLGSVLERSILGFIKNADLVGPLIKKVPVFGGFGAGLYESAREQVQQLAETQLRQSLAALSRAAAEQAVKMILADDNKRRFRAMRKDLAEKLLARRVKELVPDDATIARIRREVWEAAVSATDAERVLGPLARLYEAGGEDSPLGQVLSGALELLADRTKGDLTGLLVRFLTTESAFGFLQRHPLPGDRG